MKELKCLVEFRKEINFLEENQLLMKFPILNVLIIPKLFLHDEKIFISILFNVCNIYKINKI